MHASKFNLNPGRVQAKDLAKAIRETEGNGDTLVIDPGKYELDEPAHPIFDEHHTDPWGISGFGATFIARYTDPLPLVELEVVGQGQCRNLTLNGLGLQATSPGQQGFKLTAKGTGHAFYRFALNQITAQGCVDGIVLEGNVFETEIFRPSVSDGENGIAIGNTEEGGIISAVNVWGGSLSQVRKDGLRTYSDVQYREPYDIQLWGTYFGNVGRYAIDAKAGLKLAKGVTMENPWSDIATHDPKNEVEHAGLKFANFANLENINCGGNGYASALADGYLSTVGALIMRECKCFNWSGRPVKLAKLDAQEGAAFCYAQFSPGRIEATDRVRVTQIL